MRKTREEPPWDHIAHQGRRSALQHSTVSLALHIHMRMYRKYGVMYRVGYTGRHIDRYVDRYRVSYRVTYTHR